MMSDFEDMKDDASHGEGERETEREGDQGGDISAMSAAADAAAVDREPDLDTAASIAGDSVADNTIASAPTNPRKRKKSSRASVYSVSLFHYDSISGL